MKFLVAPVRFIYLTYAVAVFVALMLWVVPVVLVAALFGKMKGGNLIYRACMFWADTWYFSVGIRHRNVYLEPTELSKPYIFIANHISYLDAPLILKSLRQPVRVLGKAEYGKIPIFGFIYRNAIVTVDRSNALKRAQSVRTLKSILKKGISIFIFPEGTFNETGRPLKKFYDGAFRIAIETATPIKPMLFLHGFDRMHYTSIFSLNPGKSVTVFLEEVPVDGYTLATLPELKEKVFRLMEKKLLEYNAAWVTCGAVRDEEQHTVGEM